MLYLLLPVTARTGDAVSLAAVYSSQTAFWLFHFFYPFRGGSLSLHSLFLWRCLVQASVEKSYASLACRSRGLFVPLRISRFCTPVLFSCGRRAGWDSLLSAQAGRLQHWRATGLKMGGGVWGGKTNLPPCAWPFLLHGREDTYLLCLLLLHQPPFRPSPTSITPCLPFCSQLQYLSCLAASSFCGELPATNGQAGCVSCGRAVGAAQSRRKTHVAAATAGGGGGGIAAAGRLMKHLSLALYILTASGAQKGGA